jgi:hypothetical protein
VKVAVGVRVFVAVGVLVLVGVNVGVLVDVRVGVKVCVGVEVRVGVNVRVGVGVIVGVFVIVGVAEGVKVRVGVSVAERQLTVSDSLSPASMYAPKLTSMMSVFLPRSRAIVPDPLLLQSKPIVSRVPVEVDCVVVPVGWVHPALRLPSGMTCFAGVPGVLVGPTGVGVPPLRRDTGTPHPSGPPFSQVPAPCCLSELFM